MHAIPKALGPTSLIEEPERTVILNALEVASAQWAQALATAESGSEEAYARIRFEEISRVLERWKA